MKQTVVTNQGTTFKQEITPNLGVEPILERILAQTTQHLAGEDNINADEINQLGQLIDAIEAEDINEDNFEEYMQLWFPEVLSDEAGHKTVQLTVYDDGSSRFRCYIPGTFFQIFEY